MLYYIFKQTIKLKEKNKMTKRDPKTGRFVSTKRVAPKKATKKTPAKKAVKTPSKKTSKKTK